MIMKKRDFGLEKLAIGSSIKLTMFGGNVAQGGFYIDKIGGVCVIRGTLQIGAAYTLSDQVIGTIPDGYRPINSVSGFFLHGVARGTLYVIDIQPTGGIFLRALPSVGAAQNIQSGDWLTMAVPYITGMNPLAG